MPTVNELIEQVCRETGLDETSGSDERALALSSLTRALRRILAELKVRVETASSVDITPTDVDVSLSTEAPGLVRVTRVVRVDGDTEYALERVGPARLREGRPATAEGVPTAYAVEGDSLLLDLVDGTTTLRLYYVAAPTSLADGGTEASVTIDPLYHEDLLGTLAVAYILEGYEGEEQRASYFRGLHSDTLRLYKMEVARRGGELLARVDDVGRWDTPANAEAR